MSNKTRKLKKEPELKTDEKVSQVVWWLLFLDTTWMQYYKQNKSCLPAVLRHCFPKGFNEVFEENSENHSFEQKTNLSNLWTFVRTALQGWSFQSGSCFPSQSFPFFVLETCLLKSRETEEQCDSFQCSDAHLKSTEKFHENREEIRWTLASRCLTLNDKQQAFRLCFSPVTHRSTPRTDWTRLARVSHLCSADRFSFEWCEENLLAHALRHSRRFFHRLCEKINRCEDLHALSND